MAWKIPRSVLVVIHTEALQVLLIERADHRGFWQSVTGSVDADDEPVRDTAVREVREETGLDATAFRLVDWQFVNEYDIYPQWRWRYAPGVTRNSEHVFGLVLPAPVPVTLAPREHVAQVWLPWEEAARRCFSPSNAAAIRQLPARMDAAATRPVA
ncbi:MAG: dihydroneopterin triphosphate diphosphatase [Burkholderiales bacterium]|jgi:dATP pyrophosphohydrolase|nr:dihydroneopterin triphosphate diphosphatase [Burkholderiales bacterium]